MGIDTLGNKLLQDIDIAYDEAINTRVLNIQEAVNEIVNNFKVKKHSLMGIANLDALNDYSQIPTSEIIPSLIKIGYYKHLRNSDISTSIPAIVDIGNGNGLNVAYTKINEESGCKLIQNIAIRIALSLPDNFLNVKIFDASSNGANFSFLLALDKVKSNFYSTENAIHNELNNVLSELTIIQTDKLSFQYQTVEEYNRKESAKIPYQVIIINNYPDNFIYRRDSLSALKKIIENGKKYGILVLMTTDLDLLQKNATGFGFTNEIDGKIGTLEILGDGKVKSLGIKELDDAFENFSLAIDSELPAKRSNIITFLNNRLIEHEKREKEKSKNAFSFENFYQEAKLSNNFWTSKSDENIRIPLGFPVNYKPYDSNHSYFHLGILTDEKGNKVGNYHGLIGGETGSGKSVLINNLIINSCYYYSPEELQFIIIDLKGNEYPEYHKLPHIKVLFQDSSKIDIGLNVLDYIKSIYEERVQLFKKAKVNEFSQYRTKEKLPRLVCIIDEFQSFNQSENNEIKRKSAEIIDLIVGKGRAYGIHLILASQSLANVNINSASLTNINVRLVLRLDEQSSRQILSPGNNETLKFPDLQLAYNNTRGYEKNDNKIIKLPFLKGNLITPHIEYFDSKLTEQLNYNKKKYLLPGEEDVLLDSNVHITESISKNQSKEKKIYVGTPYFIKEDDNYISFNAESENNLLMIGQDYNTAYRLISLLIRQFMAYNPENKVYYLNYVPKSSKFYSVFNSLNSEKFKLDKSNDAEGIYDLLIEEIARRKDIEHLESEYLLVLPQLNTDASLNTRMSPLMAKIKTILETGPAVGIYSVVFVESYNALGEINSLNNLSKFKIALRGGESNRIMPNKASVDDDGFIYLSAPSPYTIMNPDYVNVFNSYSTSFQISDLGWKSVIEQLFNRLD